MKKARVSRSGSICVLLASALAACSGQAQTAAPAPGSVAVSDAAYAEVSALSYAALRQAAVALKDALNNATSQDTTMVLLTRETVDGQLALSSAVTQLNGVNERFCTLLRSPAQASPSPSSGAFRPEFAFGAGDIGTIASGAASLAQLFTPHGSSGSIELTPDLTALLADLVGAGRPVILPDLYFPTPGELAPDQATAQKPCSHTYLGPQATAPQDFPTLWLAAQVSAAQLRSTRKPNDDTKAALAAYDDLAKAYLTADPKNGTVYSQILRAQALRRFLDPAKKPVVFVLGIDAMGGTTSEGGKTSFTSHIRYSGGVVVHYLAWQLGPDGPMKPVAGGTITRTLSNQSESDILPLLNH